MALLTTTPYNPQRQNDWLAEVLRIGQQVKEAQARTAAVERARKDASMQAAVQDHRRAIEFDRRLEFDKARTAADDARLDEAQRLEKEQLAMDNAPFTVPPGTFDDSSLELPESGTPASAPGTFSAGGSPSPGFTMGGGTPETMTVNATGYHPYDVKNPKENLMEGGTKTAVGTPVRTLGQFERGEASHVSVAVPQGSPLFGKTLTSPDRPGVVFKAEDVFGTLGGELVKGNKIDVAVDSRKDASKITGPMRFVVDNNPEVQVARTAKYLERNKFPTKQAKSILTATAAAAFSRKPATEATTQAMAQWPTNERGYKFDPENPERMFVERSTPKGSTFTQIKTTDPGYGLKPIGENTFGDENGGRYYVDEIRKGVPVYKRVEEDKEVKQFFKAADGTVVGLNKFGTEVSKTDPRMSYLTPKSKPMTGSDGRIYFADSKGGWVGEPPPSDVRFDQNMQGRVKKIMVGTDGQPYAIGKDGEWVGNPPPEGTRFDKPKDETAISHWDVDEKTGDLHGFNFKGEKVAVTEGDYAKITGTAKASARDAMSEEMLYGQLSLPVKNLWSIYDRIRAMGLDPHTSHEELVAKGGETGATLSKARASAQTSASKIKLRGGAVVGLDFAEGKVRDYEMKRLAAGGSPPVQTPPSPAGPPPASAATASAKPLDAATAKALLQEAGGDKEKARALARARGYTL